MALTVNNKKNTLLTDDKANTGYVLVNPQTINAVTTPTMSQYSHISDTGRTHG